MSKLVTQPLVLIKIGRNGDQWVVEAGDVVCTCFEEPTLVDKDLHLALDLSTLKKFSTVRLSLEYIQDSVAAKECTLVNLRVIQLLKSGP